MPLASVCRVSLQQTKDWFDDKLDDMRTELHHAQDELDRLRAIDHAAATERDLGGLSGRQTKHNQRQVPHWVVHSQFRFVSLTFVAFFIALAVIVSKAWPRRSVIRTVAWICSHLAPKSQA